MPTRYIEADEWYPVYTLDERKYSSLPQATIDLTDDELADYRRVMSEFGEWQDRLGQASAESFGPSTEPTLRDRRIEAEQSQGYDPNIDPPG